MKTGTKIQLVDTEESCAACVFNEIDCCPGDCCNDNTAFIEIKDENEQEQEGGG